MAVSLLFLLFLSHGAHAAFIQNTTGLSNPGQTLSFSEVQAATGAPVSNQFAAYGVSFTNTFYDGFGAGNLDNVPNIKGDYLSNFPGVMGPALSPLGIRFSQVQTSAAFAYATNPGTSTFQALLNGVVVETATADTSPQRTDNFFGFTNTLFNEIRISVPTTNEGAAVLDNLQFAPPAPVPEPGTLSLMALGLGSLVGAARRKKKNVELA